GLLAHAAEDAAQEVHLVLVAVPLAGAVGIVRIVLRRHDRDGRGRAGHLAELAAHAHLQAVLVGPEFVPAPEARRPLTLHPRVVDGDRLAEEDLQRRRHSPGDRHNTFHVRTPPLPAGYAHRAT